MNHNINLQLTKHEFKQPKPDDPSAEFDQSFLARPVSAVILFMCDRCQSLAKNFTRKIVEGGRRCVTLPLCRVCVYTNRRCSQNVFFNIGLKNAHDYVKDEDENGGDDEEEVDDSTAVAKPDPAG